MKHILPIILFAATALYNSHASAQTGSLWSMTSANGSTKGVIFKTDSAGGSYTEVYTFTDAIYGIDPRGSLIQASDGRLYGMTSRGGASNYGVIFSIDPTNNTYTKLHDFDSVNGKAPYGALCEAANGKLYGMTFKGGATPFPNLDRGILFEYALNPSAFTKKLDLLQKNMGSAYGSLIKGSDGKLYGLSSVGGGDATGALFNYNVQLDSLSVLESFIAGPPWEGYEPMGDLVQANDGRYYGLSRHGGAGQAGGGVLFRYDPNGTMFNRMARLYSFSENLPGSLDGYDLTGSLVQATNGKLYGMTRSGGTDSAGTIFSFDLSNNSFTKVHNLDSTAEGYAPHGSLMLSTNGKLYGLITSPGGQARLFQFDPANNSVTVKANISGTPYYTKLIQLKSTTGIHEITNAGTIAVYPNPAGDNLHIDLGNNRTAQLQIISADGRIVVQHGIKEKSTIDIATLPTGIYTVKCTIDGVISTTGIAIQR